MDSLQKSDVIKGASSVIQLPLISSRNVTFYTFDGNILERIENCDDLHGLGFKLDPGAPKPKPVSYRRVQPSFQFKFPKECLDSAGAGVTLLPLGFTDEDHVNKILLSTYAKEYFIFFHDKYGNRIGIEPIVAADIDIKTFTEYDLSEAFEEPAEFNYEHNKNQN